MLERVTRASMLFVVFLDLLDRCNVMAECSRLQSSPITRE